MVPRDTQRSRVWRAEAELPASPLGGLARCTSFVDRVVGSLWWVARFPDHAVPPRLRPGQGARSAFYRADDGSTITVPRRYRTKGVLLHELAHWALDDAGVAAHGPTFTRVVLDAVGEFCGPDRAATLEVAYERHRVRVGPPPSLVNGRLDYTNSELELLATKGR